MKEVDYIVVGLGIAGIAFCEQLRANGKSFVVFDSGATTSTTVSGGVFNPMVLKRFTKAWMAHEHLPYAISFYESLCSKFNTSVFSKIPIYRIFNSVEEQNNWAIACDKRELAPFLFSELIKNDNENVNAPFGFGKVRDTGRIQPDKLLGLYAEELRLNEALLMEVFEYKLLKESTTGIEYKSIRAKKIVFAEGIAARKNPYFPKKLLIGNKGEYIIIKAPGLDSDVILKGSLFIIPLGESLFKVGATYKREDYSLTATEEAQKEIISKLKLLINCDFKIKYGVAGIRPTTRDRRPLLGKLNHDSNMAFLNGLGARGIMMAPLLGKMLYKSLEEGKELPNEITINRFN